MFSLSFSAFYLFILSILLLLMLVMGNRCATVPPCLPLSQSRRPVLSWGTCAHFRFLLFFCSFRSKTTRKAGCLLLVSSALTPTFFFFFFRSVCVVSLLLAQKRKWKPHRGDRGAWVNLFYRSVIPLERSFTSFYRCCVPLSWRINTHFQFCAVFVFLPFAFCLFSFFCRCF
jgi:hypothetical protein